MSLSLVERNLDELKIVNLGCGGVLLKDAINVDNFGDSADIKADLLKPLPFPDNRFEEARLSHVIEHLPFRRHIAVLEEIHRILKPNGILKIGYPEFEVCVNNFLNNVNGDRWNFWVQTLYGEQTVEGRYHIAPITREHITQQLFEVGFYDVQYQLVTWNGVIECKKGTPLPWY